MRLTFKPVQRIWESRAKINDALLVLCVASSLIFVLLKFTNLTTAIIAIISVIAAVTLRLFPDADRILEHPWLRTPLATSLLTTFLLATLIVNGYLIVQPKPTEPPVHARVVCHPHGGGLYVEPDQESEKIMQVKYDAKIIILGRHVRNGMDHVQVYETPGRPTGYMRHACLGKGGSW